MTSDGDRVTRRLPSDDRKRLEATRLLDALCDDYEAATRDGSVAPFDAFLERVAPDLRGELVGELTGIARDRLRSLGIADPLSRILEVNANLPPEYLSRVKDCVNAEGTQLYLRPEGDAPARAGRKGPSRGLRIRCPHCSNHVELLADAPLDSVDCVTCGSSFSLIDDKRETRAAETLKRIDRFELIARLGVGGFGTVWKARDTQLDRAVAVKIPRRGQLSPEEAEQFLREARSAAQLSHPNIVPVHEVGREGEAVFIVSDLVRGVSLADQLTSGRPSAAEAVRLIAPIADALDHAHQRGVVHRDLKPSNVMIQDDGSPRLMDFGLAKREAEEVTVTTDGQIVGTPAYMSPEQALGKSAWADRRTDVYSLGVMLFELLTGELPFRGNAQMQVRQRVTDDAPNARRLNRSTPVDLATITAKCLERDPGRRYQTAAEVRDELRRYLEKRPIVARPLSPLQRAVRWAERHPSRAALVAVTGLVAIAGPTAAVVIEGQRARLAALVGEKDRLILRSQNEAAKANEERSRLSDELDVWRGKANPWDLWPPDADRPPKRRQLGSLYTLRGDALKQAPSGESDLSAARRALTLALLHESGGRRREARLSLRAAVAPLRRLRRDRPRSLAVAAALLSAYDDLARLSASADDRSVDEWTRASQTLADELGAEFPDDPLVQATRVDRDLRSAVALGFDAASAHLERIAEADARLATLWPESPTELYRIACELAGVAAPLAEVAEADPTAASD